MPEHDIGKLFNHEECQIPDSWIISYIQQLASAVKRHGVASFSNRHHACSHRITAVLESLPWLKIDERIQYKLISLTYKVYTISQPTYLRIPRNLISLQTDNNTRSSDAVRPLFIISQSIVSKFCSLSHLL